MVEPNWTCWLLSLLIGPFDSSVLILVLLLYSMKSLEVQILNVIFWYVLSGTSGPLKGKCQHRLSLTRAITCWARCWKSFSLFFFEMKKLVQSRTSGCDILRMSLDTLLIHFAAKKKLHSTPFHSHLHTRTHARTHASARTPCVHICVHTNVIVGTFVSVCFDIVGTPNIVGTHCWDSCFLDSQPYEMQMEKFSAMVPTVLLCVIVCALVNFRLSQPFLGLLGS